MKTSVIILVALLTVMTSGAFASVVLKMKDGTELNWSSYQEESGNYCTYKGGGLFCVDKKDVKSIVEVKDNTPKDANVVYGCNQDCDKSRSSSSSSNADSWYGCPEGQLFFYDRAGGHYCR